MPVKSSAARSKTSSRPSDASSWVPSLPDNGEPIYSQLLSALEADISGGRLPAGFRMPTQRDLARTLGISAGTVTKAYAEAERMGLVQGQVGRGTFVSGRDYSNGRGLKVVDLSLNIPGPRMPASLLSASLIKIGRRNDLLDYAGYFPHPGIEEHREALVSAVAKIGYNCSAENMLITNGAQHAMVMAFGAICKAGDTVLAEAATFHGMKALAEFMPLRLAGVAMDEEGLVPDALDEAARRTKSKVLFTMPTLQNPTARVMSAERRRAIVKVARKHDLLIVEDDVYGFLAEGIEPLAEIAPERTFYINSVSKCVIPALRLGLIVAPPAFLQQIYRAMRATAWMGSPLASLMISEWIRDETVTNIVREMRNEAAKRTHLAKSILGSALPSSQRPSFHIWIGMSAEDVSRTSNYARRHGVITTPMAAPIVDPGLISGLRVSIGAPEKIENLEWALKILAAGMESAEQHPSII